VQEEIYKRDEPLDQLNELRRTTHDKEAKLRDFIKNAESIEELYYAKGFLEIYDMLNENDPKQPVYVISRYKDAFLGLIESRKNKLKKTKNKGFKVIDNQSFDK
jgi:hypothetical protein